MANRLSLVLTFLVGPEQSAFVKGRRIQDALILAHEMVKDFKGSQHASMALKVDIKKAYDSVSWEFLLKILKGYGFSDVRLTWITNILTSTRYSVLINGSPHGFIQPGRGLRLLFPMLKHLMRANCQGLVDKVGNRINYWCTKLLSVAGKGSTDHSKKLHLMSWDLITRTKGEGGFGLRKLVDIQSASKVVLAS
ncbi:uncharacterized protein LOC132270485 [Cornus florida]|uniref:uncharacterized protein LOC132270485 n=1 Tax=Cornus florida TaxID=4283 RepID=UPI00289ECB2B|nr:uncharacterized protein LOC132270485 [Cornus florida]